MSNKDLSQFLPADIFLKSAVVEKNPDMSFREAVAEFFGVSPEEITRIRRAKGASGWDITIDGIYEPSQEEEDYQWDLGPEEYWDEDSEESEWMSPKDMGIAQKMDWSDDEGNEISDGQKLEYFKSRPDMYEVDDENGLVRLRAEEDWFPEDSNLDLGLGREEDSEEEDYQKYVKGIKKFIYDYSDYIPAAEKLEIVLQALDTDSAESSEAVGPAMKTIKHFLSEYDYSLPDNAIAFLKDCLDVLSDIDLELQDWEREGYGNEIAYQNRWRDYTEPEEEMDDAEEDYRRDPYSPWNY